MSGTTGGVTIKTLSGRSAAGLCEYRGTYFLDDVPAGGKKAEGYLFAATRHCSHDTATQIAEWKRTRVEHGTDCAVRRVKGKYETVDPTTGLHASGQRGTHVYRYSGGRMRKLPLRDGETPTHFYVAPNALVPYERESEAQHTIYAAAADLIDRDDIEACEKFFAAVKAERDEHYSGLQESLWLERNGKSGLVHVHVATNATIYEDFTLDGVDYRAGQKLGGQLTDIDRIRARFETYLDAHQEYGFTQALARVGTPEYKAAQRRDGQLSYWEGRRGQESAQDFMRRASADVMTETGSTDRAGFIEQMRERGVIVEETGLRRGKAGANHDYAYRLVDGKRAIRGATLGEMYRYSRVGEQLDLKAAGRELLPYPPRQSAGPAVSNSPAPDEAAELSFAVGDLAREERERQAAEQSQVQEQTPSMAQPGATATAQQRTSAADKLAMLREQYPDEIAEVEAEIRSGFEDANPATSDQLREMQDQMVEHALETRTYRRDFEFDLESRRVGREQREAAERAREAEPAPPFRSRLRGARAKGKDSVKTQERIDGLAPIEEEYRDNATDADLEARLKQLGVGQQILRDYSEHVSPAFLQVLRTREAARSEGDCLYDLGRTVKAVLPDLPENRREAAMRELDLLNGQLEDVRGLIADGDYVGARKAATHESTLSPGAWDEIYAARNAQPLTTEKSANNAVATSAKPVSATRQRILDRQRAPRERAAHIRKREEVDQSYGGAPPEDTGQDLEMDL